MKINGYFILDGEVKSFHVTDPKRGLDNVLFERARPHGEWRECEVKNIFGETIKAYECSTCKRKNIGDIWIMIKLPFCPNCGADMRKERG